MNLLANIIDSQTLIPDLLLAAPHVRPVLDRYGLHGCGGKLGPMETLEFFANAHDVSLEKLLLEIRTAFEHPEATTSVSSPNMVDEESEGTERIEDTIYRPFFKAGIMVILTLGAVWGAFLLLRIGFLKSFTAVSIHEINAHGHAQIFGWVGLFVMGFAYQAFPRFKHTTLAYPRLAYSTLWLMLAGVALRAVLEPLGLYLPAVWNVAIYTPVLEIAAAGLFVWIIVTTLARSGKPLAFYDYYILSALVWFFVQTIYSALLFAATVKATSQEELLQIIALWQAPLREMQIHGFAMLMILGVSQRMFHNFYGFRPPKPQLSLIVLAGLNAAVMGEIAGLILMRTVSHALAALWYSSILLLFIGAAVLVNNWKIFSSPGETDRNLKFLRAAYTWLFISLGMMVLLPLYQYGVLPWLAPASQSTQIEFSHAYYGAVRHAITVGFISLMIVGVAAKVVPTLNGVDLRRLTLLWGPFMLINAGCALRVAGQVMTDFSPVFFPIAGVSGVLEVSGLALWAIHLLAVMAGRGRLREKATQDAQSGGLQPGMPIAAHHVVGDVLDQYPHLLPTFLNFGFTPLKNPILRKTIARRVTLESACRKLSVDIVQLVETLNRERLEHGNVKVDNNPSSAHSIHQN